jgi:hypothetical protein
MEPAITAFDPIHRPLPEEKIGIFEFDVEELSRKTTMANLTKALQQLEINKALREAWIAQLSGMPNFYRYNMPIMAVALVILENIMLTSQRHTASRDIEIQYFRSEVEGLLKAISNKASTSAEQLERQKLDVIRYMRRIQNYRKEQGLA